MGYAQWLNVDSILHKDIIKLIHDADFQFTRTIFNTIKKNVTINMRNILKLQFPGEEAVQNIAGKYFVNVISQMFQFPRT